MKELYSYFSEEGIYARRFMKNGEGAGVFRATKRCI